MTTSNPKNAFQCRTLVLSLITGAILAAGFEFSSFQENLLEAKDQAKIDGIKLTDTGRLVIMGNMLTEKTEEAMAAIDKARATVTDFMNYTDPVHKINDDEVKALASKGMIDIHVGLKLCAAFTEDGISIGAYNTLDDQLRVVNDMNKDLLQALETGDNITIEQNQARLTTAWNTLQVELAGIRVLTTYADMTDMGHNLIPAGANTQKSGIGATDKQEGGQTINETAQGPGYTEPASPATA